MIGEKGSAYEPTNQELDEIESDLDAVAREPVWDDPLEALYDEVKAKAKPRRSRAASIREAENLVKISQRFKELYSNPENWVRKRGIALVDLESGTLIGNFSEYLHISDPHARRLVREHQPITVEGQELINGYLGAEVESRIKNVQWDCEHSITISIQLDELMVEAPEVELRVMTRFGGIIRADLSRETQFASPSGNVLLRFGPGTNVWEACSTDTKIRIRKGLPHG